MTKHIPKNFIEQLNARSNIVTLIDARVPLKKSGSNYKACCPFHQEKTPSFNVSESGQFYHCFGCGASGDSIRFLMDFDNLTFQEAVESLAQLNGMSVPYEENTSVVSNKEKELYELGLACLHDAALFYYQLFYSESGGLARDYLRKRGIKKRSVDTFLLGYAPYGNQLLEALKDKYSLDVLQAVGLVGQRDGDFYDWFRHRIVFPIFNVKGQVIAFGARAFGDEQPKYLNSPETKWFNKRYELYGLHQALRSKNKGKTLIVTEGYMDVVKLWQYGLTYSVAALGTAVGDTHIAQLKKRAEKVYFSFDGDKAGEKAAQKALEAIFKQYDERYQWRFMFMPAGEDPDSLLEKQGVEAFHSVMDGALKPSDFLIRLLEKQFGETRSVETNAQLAQQVQSWLGFITDEVYQHFLKDALKKYFSLPDLVVLRANTKSERGDYAYSKRIIPKERSLEAQSVEKKLIYFLYSYPHWAKLEYPWRYEVKVFEELSLFWQLCYHLQCSEFTQGQVRLFLEKQYGHSLEVESLRETYQTISEEDAYKEFKDILIKLSEREKEKRLRLEKLGG